MITNYIYKTKSDFLHLPGISRFKHPHASSSASSASSSCLSPSHEHYADQSTSLIHGYRTMGILSFSFERPCSKQTQSVYLVKIDGSRSISCVLNDLDPIYWSIAYSYCLPFFFSAFRFLIRRGNEMH